MINFAHNLRTSQARKIGIGFVARPKFGNNLANFSQINRAVKRAGAAGDDKFRQNILQT